LRNIQKKLSRNQNLRINKQELLKKGLPGVATTLIVPGTQGEGLLKIGKLAPIPSLPDTYQPLGGSYTGPPSQPIISQESVDTWRFLFVQYENAYIPKGDEKLFSFAVVLPLEPMTVTDCAFQLGVRSTNIRGLTRTEYETGTFTHPTYTNQNRSPLVFRYSEVPVVIQTVPGRLDNVPLGYPDFLTSPIPITTQQGAVPSPPLPDFITSLGNTGGTAIAAGGTVGFVDTSLRTPYSWKPTSWNWDFGGTGASAGASGITAQNPVVAFTVAGSYTVTLTASNSSGSNVVTKNNFVTVS
jgi:hypothetical protein